MPTLVGDIMLIIGYGSFMSQALQSLDENMQLNYYSPMHGRMGKMEILGIEELKGFGRGGYSADYPTLFKASKSSVKVLVLRCDDCKILKSLHGIEMRSRYELDFVETQFGVALVWLKHHVSKEDKLKDHTEECYRYVANEYARERFPSLFET